MLQIRDEQMSALSRSCEDRFLERLAVHLRETFPRRTEGMSEASLIQALRPILADAYRHGFTQETELAAFIELIFAFGLSTGSPRVDAILRSRYTTNAQRLEKLGRYALEAGGGPPFGEGSSGEVLM